MHFSVNDIVQNLFSKLCSTSLSDEMAVIVPTIKLNNGLDFPVLGLGTYQAEGNLVSEAVQHAIDAGYRHFDCAAFYENEKQVGQGIQIKIKQGIIKREDLFIVSKVWNNSHSRDSVIPACKKSLSELGLDYLDLYLIHWPQGYKEGPVFTSKKDGVVEFSDIDYTETWLGMEDCVKAGLVKSIGVSNFNSEQIGRVLAVAGIKPVVNQVECNPNINQKQLVKFCEERGIVITAYCPLGKAAQVRGNPDLPSASMEEPEVIDIAEKYGKTPAQVVLKYLLQSHVTVIPKSTTKSRIYENINVFDFELNDSEMKYFDSLNKNQRLSRMRESKTHKYYPFNLEY